MWQDLAISIVSVMFSYALIPQVLDGFKKKKGLINIQTSLITSLGMAMLTLVYFTLNLYFSFAIGLLATILWLTLFVQKVIYQ